MTEFLDFVLDFGEKKIGVLKPLGDRAMDLGVEVQAEIDGAREDLEPLLRRSPESQREIGEKVLATGLDRGGSLVVVYAGQDIFRMQHDLRGAHDIHLEFMDGKAADFFAGLGREITDFRQQFVDNFSENDLHDMIEIAADFLADVDEFSYRIIAEETPFIEARLDGSDLNVQLLDILVYLKTALFVLKGADFFKVKLTSPMDLLRILESVQGAIRHLAATFGAEGLRINAGVLGQTVFAAGRGVRPNITSRFGPTHIKLDSIFKILSQAVSRLNL